MNRLLGERAGTELKKLDEERAADLLGAIEAAREAQREALREAAESSLGFVPRLLRGAAKKIVFG